MSNQKSSCCGPTDEATAEPARPADTTNRTGDGRVGAHDPMSPERSPSGLLEAIRRLFGRVPA